MALLCKPLECMLKDIHVNGTGLAVNAAEPRLGVQVSPPSNFGSCMDLLQELSLLKDPAINISSCVSF